jgi:KaiC/GvpD/RAD55 family RecA-like ATPase
MRIKKFNLFDITRSIDALLAKQSGDLLIEVKPVLLPDDFRPDIIVVDSLTAIASAFSGKEGTYRLYIEQLFRFFEQQGVNTFLISETEQNPSIYSPTGVEEFLADGVIVLYNIRKGSVRETGLEVLKMRGTKHKKKIVAMQIIEGKGVEIYPEQEVFGVE